MGARFAINSHCLLNHQTKRTFIALMQQRTNICCDSLKTVTRIERQSPVQQSPVQRSHAVAFSWLFFVSAEQSFRLTRNAASNAVCVSNLSGLRCALPALMSLNLESLLGAHIFNYLVRRLPFNASACPIKFRRFV